MKIRVVNTPTGFVPETDADAELKRKLKIGSTFEVVIKEVRNPLFNRKFHAMIRIAWEYLSESDQAGFGNIDNFRYMMEVKAGFFDLMYDPRDGKAYYRAKSTAFDKMTEVEFEKVYNGVRDLIFRDYITNVRYEEFLDKLKWF